MDLLQRSASYLQERGIDNGKLEAEWLFCAVLELQRLDLYTRFDMPLDDAEVGRLRTLIQRRGRREPLAYLLGEQPFCGLSLQVGPAVLVPRPETEQLVELVLADSALDKHSAAVVDVGTGSGAIALALKQARPQWQVSGVEVSPQALAQARTNGQSNGAEVIWQESDLLADCPGPWQLVVANLPYVGEDERHRIDPELAYEPAVALFSGADGMNAISALLAQLPTALAPQGVCWLEHGDQQAAAVAAVCHGHGLQARHYRDWSDKERFTRVTLGAS